MDAASLLSDERARLLQAARDVARRAYAPYSHFKVGAAVLTEQGGLYQGCNVENASYGLTICAERAAIFSAVAQEGGETAKIQAIAVLTEHGSPASPCGACRQVIFEFGPHALVLFQGRDYLEECRASELLPKGFVLE
ncbi:MAG: cytidine deaminase [Chloroflexota bacterium]|nr:cytidine deaminase [Chloroflexota bacterium]